MLALTGRGSSGSTYQVEMDLEEEEAVRDSLLAEGIRCFVHRVHHRGNLIDQNKITMGNLHHAVF